MPFSWEKEWGKKLTWTQIHACNRKINNSLTVISPTETFLIYLLPMTHRLEVTR